MWSEEFRTARRRNHGRHALVSVAGIMESKITMRDISLPSMS